MIIIRIASIILFFLVVFGESFSQSQVRKYDIFEKVVKSDTTFKNPYTETSLKCVLKEPTKTAHFTNGFYDGNNTWKIRFAPGNYKKWNYSYQFSHTDSIDKGDFFCLWNAGIDPLSVNPVNPLWFRKMVYPLFLKGTVVSWDKLLKNDTIEFRRLKSHGVNLFYLENIENKNVAFYPLNYIEYRKVEATLSWLWNNNLSVLMPVTVFSSGQKPTNDGEWNNYLSYLYARFGGYSNILFYIPDHFGKIKFGEAEKEKLAAMMIGNDPYLHPVSIVGQAKHELIDPNYRFDLFLNGEIELKNRAKSNCPRILLLPVELYEKQESILPYLCQKFVEGTQCIIDLQRIKSKELIRQISEFWSFVDEIPYFEMKQMTDISNTKYILGEKENEYILYTERQKSVSLNPGNRFYKATWIDIENFKNRKSAGYLSGNNIVLKTPTEAKNWFLHLSHSKSGYPLGVHLSWSKQPETSLTVTWSTYTDQTNCEVKYRVKGSDKWLIKNGISEKSPGENWIHSVVLEDLKPATKYEYCVVADRTLNGIYSEIFETATAPTGKNSSFSFSFFTDTGLEGRLDNNATGTIRVMNEILFEKPDFLLGGGDYAYANRDKRFKSINDAVHQWFIQSQPLLASFPMMSQYGNHELYLTERFGNWAPYFKHPMGFRDGRHYSFDIGNVHFTSFCLVDFLPDKEELAWLENDLAQARKKGQWIIVYHHEPIFAYGTSHPSKPEISNVIYPIFRKYNVDMSICSHDQNYERTFPLSGLNASNPEFNQTENLVYKQGDGTVFLKISPCGKKSEIGNIFPLFQDVQPPFIAARDRSAFHFAMFRVFDGNSLEVKVYNVPEDNSPKYLIDSFVIQKKK